VADLIEASILKMSGNFDQIIMLDQTKESYPHFKSFISTFKLMLQIEESGQTTQFKSNLGNKNILYWYNSLRENKRLCYYPFMVLLDNHDNTSLCCKNEDAIKPVSHIKDWQTDPDYNVFREAMLKGQHIDRCVDCYFREDEAEGGYNVVMLGHTLAEGLFPNNEYPIGKTIKVAGRNCKVIGLFKKEGESNQFILKKHMQSKEPTVIISPSLTTGIDLKDDLSRFQIIVKLPFMSLSDPRVKKKIE
jgi:hypothetical protein